VSQPEVHLFADAGDIPNNPRLPLLIYKAVISAGGGELADALEDLYAKNDWRAAWRYGVYPFAHYHSTAHEVLGVYRGHALIRLGYTVGISAHVEAGDVIVIPAGVGHQNLGASPDFHVVGGYPVGQQPDLLRGNPGERPAADQRIAAVLLPKTDPVYGRNGPLVKLWNI
jgi:uncharacterized protein YjlB